MPEDELAEYERLSKLEQERYEEYYYADYGQACAQLHACDCKFCQHNAEKRCECEPCQYVRRNGWDGERSHPRRRIDSQEWMLS